MEKFVENKEVIADSAKPSVVAWINRADKESFILDNLTGNNFKLTHTNDPEISEDGEHVRLVGIPKLNSKNEPLSEVIISALIPFLEVKFEHLKPITLKNLPFKYMVENIKISDNSYYGEIKPFKDLDGDNAVIVWVGNAGTNAVLCSSENSQKARGVFVFSTIYEAMLALQAFRAFPPFGTSPFYENAEIVKLKEVNPAELDNERFIYFDMWMKCVANLSNHMIRTKGTTAKEINEQKRDKMQDPEIRRIISIKLGINEKRWYVRRIKKPAINGCIGCIFKHADIEGKHEGCTPYNTNCVTKDGNFIYKTAKNPNFKQGGTNDSKDESQK
jgi:hypothetical protein